MDIKEIIPFSEFEDIFKINIDSSLDLITFFKNLNDNVLTQPNLKTETLERFFLVINEDLPFSDLTSENNSSFSKSKIIEDYAHTGGRGRLNKKTDFIRNYNYKVYAGVKTSDYFVYKGTDNLDSEVERILNDVDINGKFKTFITEDFIPVSENSDVINLASEFLTINETVSGMLSSKRIAVYSALLNFSYEEISRTDYYSIFLNNIIPDKTIFDENWDTYSKIFKEFLIELGQRTINY